MIARRLFASILIAGALIPSARSTPAPGESFWAGGFGKLEGDAPYWNYTFLELSEMGRKIQGRIHADYSMNDFKGTLRDGKIEARFGSRTRNVRFSGKLEEDGSVVVGTARYRGRTDPFRWFRLHVTAASEEARQGFEGFYEGEGRRLLVQTSSRVGQLVVEDLDSGRVRLLLCRAAGRFTAGPSYLACHPVTATYRFDAKGEGPTTLTVEDEVGAVRLTRRSVFRSEDYRYEAPDGIAIKGTLFLPLGHGEGPHPALVWVHGSGRSSRRGAGRWPYVLADLGFACLAVDKRGVGESGGTYEMPDGGHDNPPHMARRAGDVRAAVRSLGNRPDIDAKRIGLIGGSQAGWVAPQAARDDSVQFVILLSAGTTAWIYEGLYSDWAREMETGPDAPPIEKVLARLRDRRPEDPDLRPPGIRDHLVAMSCPGLWLYGLKDRSNPSQICIELLQEIAKTHDKDFTVVSFPDANHGLLECRFGGAAEIGALDRRVPGVTEAIVSWLGEKKLLPRTRSGH